MPYLSKYIIPITLYFYAVSYICNYIFWIRLLFIATIIITDYYIVLDVFKHNLYLINLAKERITSLRGI